MIVFCLIVLIFSGCVGTDSTNSCYNVSSQQFYQNISPEEILDQLSLREKVGQLFVIRPDQLLTDISEDSIHDSKKKGVTSVSDQMRNILKQYPAGGFAVFGKNITSPEQLKALNAQLKSACSVPPIIAVDEEGGRVARVANANGFSVPKVGSMEKIGKTGVPDNARYAALQIGDYLNEYGFTMDFAPDSDINTNPKNIVIGDRAFGSDPQLVSKMAEAYIDGLHECGILSVIKHFPGHGDTAEDTHTGYVAVHKTWQELLDTELIPFIDNFENTDAVMVAHITLDHVTDDGLPATLSKQLITGKLREELGYDGLVITDALAMGAIEKNYSSAEAVITAFDAGNDILLMPHSYTEAFNGLVEAVIDGRISEERLNESVLRILRAKSSERS